MFPFEIEIWQIWFWESLLPDKTFHHAIWNPKICLGLYPIPLLVCETLVYCWMWSDVSLICLSQSQARVRPVVRRVFQTSTRPWRWKRCIWTQGKKNNQSQWIYKSYILQIFTAHVGFTLRNMWQYGLPIISPHRCQIRLFMLVCRGTKSA